jgi:signal transduction histidine kinase
MKAAGLEIDLRVEGRPCYVPAGLGLSAYRILQEALTNTLKHAGPVGAEVIVRYRTDDIEVECLDQGPRSAVDPGNMSSGHGLIEMKERVAMLGGEVTAGPLRGRGFRVRARLPLRGR